MKLREHIRKFLDKVPWVRGWKAYNGTSNVTSMSGQSLMEWLTQNGKRRGIWSEITYFTCLKTLSETLGKLPWKAYKATRQGIKESKKKDVIRVLKYRPNPFMTPTIFWSTVEMNRNHFGNGYAYIQREFKRMRYGGTYRIKHLWIMPSHCVKVLVDDAGIFASAGKVWYWYTDPWTGKHSIFRHEDVIHVKTSHSLNGLTSLSVQEILRETITGAQNGQTYMNKLYEQGMTAKATLEYTGALSPEAKEALRQAFEDFGNGPQNTGRIMPVPLGMKLTPLDIKLTDAQFFELRKYTALQIAGAFGVKPNQINDYEKSSYSNSEMQQLSFLTETMLFILKQYEEEVGYKLLGEEAMEGGEYVKINEKALLRTDSKTQMEVMTGYTNAGIYLINESRGHLDMESIEYGDRALVNGTMIPLDVAVNKTGTATTTAQQPPDPPKPPGTEEDPAGEEDQEGGEEDAETDE